MPAEEAAVSEVSEAELQEFLGKLGAGGTPLFLPTPDFMAFAGTVEGGGQRLSFVFSFVFHARSPFRCSFLGAHHIFLGQAWAEGGGELATSRYCADSGQETDCI